MLFDNLTSLSEVPVWLLVIAIVWSFFWKVLSMWKAAMKGHRIWFVMLLVVNTLGILEILYIYLFSELKLDGKKKTIIKPRLVKSKRKK